MVVKGGTTSLMAKWCVPMPCLVVLPSSTGEGQGRGLGEPEATTQLESVSAEKLTEHWRVGSMERLWDVLGNAVYLYLLVFLDKTA